MDPSLGWIISKSNLVDIPLMVVLTFLQTSIGSIRPWSANFSYIPDSYSRVLPNCSQVSRVIMFTCDPKSSTTCQTWYPSISRSTSGSASLLSLWFRLQIFFVCFYVLLLCFILYNKSMNWDIALSSCTKRINSLTVLCRLSLASSCLENYLNIFVVLLYNCFCVARLG